MPIKRVRTPEGAEWFGAPIGTPIRAAKAKVAARVKKRQLVAGLATKRARTPLGELPFGNQRTRRITAQDRADSKPWVDIETVMRPKGKTVTLYHRTSKYEAQKLSERGFKRRYGEDTKQVYFSDVPTGGAAEDFGEGMVEVRLPRSALPSKSSAHMGTRSRRLADAGVPVENPEWETNREPETWYEVDSKHLKGVKVRRIASAPDVDPLAELVEKLEAAQAVEDDLYKKYARAKGTDEEDQLWAAWQDKLDVKRELTFRKRLTEVSEDNYELERLSEDITYRMHDSDYAPTRAKYQAILDEIPALQKQNLEMYRTPPEHLVQGAPENRAHAIRGANPAARVDMPFNERLKRAAFFNNCQRVYAALELRRRGWKVKANPRTGPELEDWEIAAQWLDPETGKPPQFVRVNSKEDMIAKITGSQPVGATGAVMGAWKSTRNANGERVGAGGHIWNYEVVLGEDGKKTVIWIEAQSSKRDDVLDDYAADLDWGDDKYGGSQEGVHFARLDNVEPNWEMLTKQHAVRAEDEPYDHER